MIEEAKRPGEYMTAFEDEHGTYIMNSKDLRAIAHVERLTQMGVHCLKIEGAAPNPSTTARAPLRFTARRSTMPPPANRSTPAGDPAATPRVHRRLLRHTHDDYQNYEYGYSVSERQQFVGEFTGERNSPLAAVAVK